MLTILQAAERLGVGSSIIAEWCRKGIFPNAIRDMSDRYKRWRIPESDLVDFNPPLRRLETFLCTRCGDPFHPRKGNDKYCSDRCARKTPDGTCPSCKKRPSKEGYKLCAECIEKSRRIWANRSPEQKAKLAEGSKQYRKQHPEKGLEAGRRSNKKAKLAALAHYGTSCACCGEADYRFLTIDHINNNGAAHRREIFGSETGGARFYRWTRNNGFPDDLQTLCYNCNMARAKFGGICPHKIPLDESDS